MKKHAFAPPAILIATLMMAIGFATAPALISAQAAATPAPATGELHPAHIHDGTCANLGDVVYPLNNVANRGGIASPEASTSMATTSTPESTTGTEETSVTTVDVSLKDLLNGKYAVNAHQSPEMLDVYIACGEITGTPVDGVLTIEMKEQNDSGYSGRTELKDNGDGTTTVTIMLMKGSVAATPEMSPVATPAS